MHGCSSIDGSGVTKNFENANEYPNALKIHFLLSDPHPPIHFLISSPDHFPLIHSYAKWNGSLCLLFLNTDWKLITFFSLSEPEIYCLCCLKTHQASSSLNLLWGVTWLLVQVCLWQVNPTSCVWVMQWGQCICSEMYVCEMCTVEPC